MLNREKLSCTDVSDANIKKSFDILILLKLTIRLKFFLNKLNKYNILYNYIWKFETQMETNVKCFSLDRFSNISIKKKLDIPMI